MKLKKYIYIQISEKLMWDIVTGEYCPGAKIPSVRKLAKDFSINQNTMQKSLQELERIGIVYSKRTKGWFVTENRDIHYRVRNDIIKKITEDLLKQLIQLGYKPEETIILMRKVMKQHEDV